MTDPTKADFAINGTDLPRGSGAVLDEATQTADQGSFQFDPSLGANSGEEALGFVAADTPDPDGLDDELFAPTDFPSRPLTHGASFGPGANVARKPNESEQSWMGRIAQNVLDNRADLPEEAIVWAARVAAGE